MRQIAVTITPLQSANIIRNLTQDGVSIILKRTMTKGERQGGGFLPLIMAAAPAIGAALGTGALSGAAGFGTQALLNELTGSGIGPTVTLSKTQWARLTNAGKTKEPIVINFKVSKSKNNPRDQAGGNLGQIMPMLVKALEPAARAAGNAAGKAAIKAGQRLATRGVKATEQRIGQMIGGPTINTTIKGKKPKVAVRPKPGVKRPGVRRPVVRRPMRGRGVFQDMQGTIGDVPLIGQYAQRAIAPVATAEYLAEQAPRLINSGRALYGDAMGVGNTARGMMGVGYKLAGEGKKKRRR